ncbi:lymphocyte antigen 86 isoform X1 [Sardina pilchardus]|uniref:lymphocyte antigen 86 isoform X1 n=1 Tax=Sardina pilchardus TaxID=27697 RepID=UPI002E112E62
MALSFLSLTVFLLTTMAEGIRWPEHVVCPSHHFQLSYVSCDPFQDVGFTLNPCTDLHVQKEFNTTISILLQHSIEELYLSLDLLDVNKELLLHYDEPLCLHRLPRFPFCGRKKGELINHDWPLKMKPRWDIPFHGHFNVWIQLLNQDGYQIACANMEDDKTYTDLLASLKRKRQLTAEDLALTMLKTMRGWKKCLKTQHLLS